MAAAFARRRELGDEGREIFDGWYGRGSQAHATAAMS